MAIEGKAKIYRVRNRGYIIYIPKNVGEDSQFPFKHGEGIAVRIDVENGRLVIERA